MSSATRGVPRAPPKTARVRSCFPASHSLPALTPRCARCPAAPFGLGIRLWTSSVPPASGIWSQSTLAALTLLNAASTAVSCSALRHRRITAPACLHPFTRDQLTEVPDAHTGKGSGSTTRVRTGDQPGKGVRQDRRDSQRVTAGWGAETVLSRHVVLKCGQTVQPRPHNDERQGVLGPLAFAA